MEEVCKENIKAAAGINSKNNIILIRGVKEYLE
jgi:hypothetical protein